MTILGLSLFGIGYVVAYYGVNVLYHAYQAGASGDMNPAPLTVLLGIPGAGTQGLNGDQGTVGPQGPARSGQ